MKRYLVFLVAAMVVGVCLLFDAVRVTGLSMSPTLCDADIVITRKLWPAEDVRGKVVLAWQGGDLVLKRAIAADGDKLRIIRGEVIRNGTPIQEPYICESDSDIMITWPDPESPGQDSASTVPGSSVFLLGDNRAESGDSRIRGAVSQERIRGAVVARLPKTKHRLNCGCLDKHGVEKKESL